MTAAPGFFMVGPWEARFKWGEDAAEVRAGECLIARVVDEDMGGEMARANARLIACAPEMLDLLNKASEALYREGLRELSDSLDAVIAKAVG